MNNRNWLIPGAVILVMTLFLGLSALNSGPGFPLDDAWIHQTYARNLARNGRWEFVPGVISSGSTAPLWTSLLAVGYLLKLPYLLWSNLLGGLSLWLLAWAGMRLWRQSWPELGGRDWLIGLILVTTWPMVWAAASGMETILFAALGLALVSQWQVASNEWQVADCQSSKIDLKSLIILGLLSGLLILVRPDGLILLLLLVMGLLIGEKQVGKRVRVIGIFLGTAVLPLLPYFAFNLWSSGSIWPNTFYAKQVEYAQLLAEPLITRFTRLLFFSLGGPENGWRGMSGARLLLLPGLIPAVVLALRSDWIERRIYRLLPLIWAGGHVALYAWRLPVTYQHGRYLMPAFPVWILYGLAGWVWLLTRIPAGRIKLHFLSRQVAQITFAVLLLSFLLLGGKSFAQDVAFIEGEMVTVAHWLADNSSADALIAAHDIGAVGYFAERPLLDLAGLITPEIIPMLADETRMVNYLLDHEAAYLVTAPGWPYETITASDSTTLVFTSDFTWTQENQLNNMAVYRLNLP